MLITTKYENHELESNNMSYKRSSYPTRVVKVYVAWTLKVSAVLMSEAYGEHLILAQHILEFIIILVCMSKLMWVQPTRSDRIFHLLRFVV